MYADVVFDLYRHRIKFKNHIFLFPRFVTHILSQQSELLCGKYADISTRRNKNSRLSKYLFYLVPSLEYSSRFGVYARGVFGKMKM